MELLSFADGKSEKILAAHSAWSIYRLTHNARRFILGFRRSAASHRMRDQSQQPQWALIQIADRFRAGDKVGRIARRSPGEALREIERDAHWHLVQ